MDIKNEVDMRVGVYIGIVLCGIVGSLRFKFDVWFNDVNLVNRMETVGFFGRVYIIVIIFKFFVGYYIVEDGNGSLRYYGLEGIKIYFIVGRKNGMKKLMNLFYLSGRKKKLVNLNVINVSMNENVFYYSSL